MKSDDLEKELLELLGEQTDDTQHDELLSQILEDVEVGRIDRIRPSAEKQQIESDTALERSSKALTEELTLGEASPLETDGASEVPVSHVQGDPLNDEQPEPAWSADMKDANIDFPLEENLVAGGTAEEKAPSSHEIDPMLSPSVMTEKKGRSILGRLMSLYDNKNWPDSLIGSTDPWPKKVYMGFLQNVRKKDLISYIDEWVVDNNCNRSSCSYQVRQWGNGWAFEIHEGGPGSGALNSALKALEEGKEVVVPSSDRFLKVVRRLDGFSSYFLNEFEAQEPSNEVVFKDSLTPLYKRNHGLMLAGVLSAVVSIGVMLSSWLAVYVIYGKDQVPVYAPTNYELPSQQIGKISDIANRNDAFLRSLTFISGNWKLNLEQVAPPEFQPILEQQSAPVPMMHHESAELTQLRHELTNTLSQETP